MERNSIFLWLHMHQPDYLDPISEVQVLPWVRRNLTRGYWLIPCLLKKTGFKANINFSGSLIEQILRYQNENFIDVYEAIENKNPEDLTEAEYAFLIRYFFNINGIKSKRFLYLEEKKNKGEKFSKQEILDAQVLFKLSAFAPLDQEIKNLNKKEEFYTKSDKDILISFERKIKSEILLKYIELIKEDLIELTFSPYHHPILPLLIDIKSAKKSKSNEVIPDINFSLVDDAREQIVKSIELFESVFGIRPVGMWPSEGSISSEVFDLANEYGVKWLGSDELVLRKNSERKQGVYTFKGIKTVFRSHFVSDKIAFVYNNLETSNAISDIKNLLKELNSIYIIIDGENPWEHYNNSGLDFLTSFFEEFAAYSLLGKELTSNEEINSLIPGSWINGYFDTWIGNSETNTAWSYLMEAALKLKWSEKSHEEILRAEGSDYFWWYSEFHKKEVNGVFDELFRKRLIKSYNVAGEKAPFYLNFPIK